MRYHFFLHYGWFLQNFEKDFIPTLLHTTVKFGFSKKATKIDEVFTVDLTLATECQMDGEEFVNFCGLLRKQEL